MVEYLRKYATATDVYIRMVKRAVVDHAVGADWTPAAGDVKVHIDGGAAANITSLPSAIASGNGALWKFSFTTGELTGKKISVEIADSATKAVEDNAFEIITFGHASAEIVQDLSASVAQTGDSYARIGANGVSLSAIPDLAGVTTLLARLSAARATKLDGITIRDGTAQAGAAGSITLDAGASATNDLYKDAWVTIVSATGAGQTRLISGYTGATKIAAVAPNWAINPDNTSVFSVIPAGKISGVTLVDTVTTLTNIVTAAAIRAEIDSNSTQLAAVLAALQIIDDFVDDLEGRLTGTRAALLDQLAAFAAGKYNSVAFGDAVKTMYAVLVLRSSGAGTTNPKVLGADGTTIIDATADANGNVTASTVTP